MITAAHVWLRNGHGHGLLDWLRTSLAAAGIASEPTEWRGYAAVIPQLLIHTKPVALTIQVEDDPEYVPDELEELVEEVTGIAAGTHVDALASCNARLALQSTSPPRRLEDEGSVTVFAQTDLDPASPEVDALLATLSRLTGGFTVDCVNSRFRLPGSTTWSDLS
jgi:hypothetical protein